MEEVSKVRDTKRKAKAFEVEAPVVKLDITSGYGPEVCRFESYQEHQILRCDVGRKAPVDAEKRV